MTEHKVQHDGENWIVIQKQKENGEYIDICMRESEFREQMPEVSL